MGPEMVGKMGEIRYADQSRTCEGCGHVKNSDQWQRCFAPGRCRGYIVGTDGRFLPYVPAWCPVEQKEAG